jgi:large subunit ribosomal protein L25
LREPSPPGRDTQFAFSEELTTVTAPEITLPVEPRTEFGKGAARRTRRAGKIPAVLYGHNTDPRHLSLPAHDFARVIRDHGRNSVLTLRVEGTQQLALTKSIATHPLRNYIEHVDLLVVRRGEKVTVDVPVVVAGEPETGAIYYQDMDTVSIEADALRIPEQIDVSVDELEIGTQIHAGDLELPTGTTLVTDPEYLVVNVTPEPTAEEMESEIDTEGAGVVEEESEEERDEAPVSQAGETAAATEREREG